MNKVIDITTAEIARAEAANAPYRQVLDVAKAKLRHASETYA